MKFRLRALACCLLCCLTLQAQPFLSVRQIRGSDFGALQNHLTCVFQDPSGLIWIGSFDGLCQYDGYSIRKFKSPLMDNNRVDDIFAGPDGGLICSSGGSYVMFDPTTAQFSLPDQDSLDAYLPAAAQQTVLVDSRGRRFAWDNAGELRCTAAGTDSVIPFPPGFRCQNPEAVLYEDSAARIWIIFKYDGSILYFDESAERMCFPQGAYTAAERIRYFFQDRQGNLWFTLDRDIDVVTLRNPVARHLGPADREVTSIRQVGDDRIWIGSKDGTLQLYDPEMNSVGYLTPDGRIQTQHRSFAPSAISSIETGQDGSIWVASRYDGLYRLQGEAGRYSVRHYGAGQLANDEVFSVSIDGRGRVWAATFRGGLDLFDGEGFTHFLSGLRVRRVCEVQDGILLVGTGDGLFAIDARSDDPEQFRIHQHNFDPDRSDGLPANDITFITVGPKGEIWLATANEGICRLLSPDPLAETLLFRQISASDGLASDVVLSVICDTQGVLYATSERSISRIGPGTDAVSTFRQEDFPRPFLFSGAAPQRIGGNLCLGTSKGLICIDPQQLDTDDYVPPMVLTGISIDNANVNRMALPIRLARNERDLTLRFAALDYRGNDAIRYAFKMDDTEEWIVSDSHTAYLLNLSPGAHRFSIRSTNERGQWMDNTLQVPIYARPKFFETTGGKALIALGLIALCLLLYSAIRLYLQMRTQIEIKRSLEKSRRRSISSFVQDLTRIIEQDIANPDLSIAQIAERMNMSRSSLYNRIKSDTGMSPSAFLNEIRLKRAVQLLEADETRVSEVAYSVGFNDPKYFARCFRKRFNISPSNYRKCLIDDKSS